MTINSKNVYIPVDPRDVNTIRRNKWIIKQIKKLPEGCKLLDAGAGERKYQQFCKHLKYTSQDFAQYDGLGDGKGLQTKIWNNKGLDIVSDITKIPRKDASFDAVLCSEVLEHLPEPLKALVEFKRLLKRGGFLILTAPFGSLTHFAPYHYSTGFNRYYFEKNLSDLGFNIVEIKNNGNYFEYLIQEIRRTKSIASKYSNGSFSWIERKALNVVLKALQRFASDDSGSDELLCFGYHVLAKKK